MREQIGGRYDICFQETRISGIPFDKSIKQGGKVSLCLFNLMMKSVFRKIQKHWDEQQLVVKIKGSEEGRMNHMIFADNCYRFAEDKNQMLKMISDAVENLKKRGLDWKEEEMEMISWASMETLGI